MFHALQVAVMLRAGDLFRQISGMTSELYERVVHTQILFYTDVVRTNSHFKDELEKKEKNMGLIIALI